MSSTNSALISTVLLKVLSHPVMRTAILKLISNVHYFPHSLTVWCSKTYCPQLPMVCTSSWIPLLGCFLFNFRSETWIDKTLDVRETSAEMLHFHSELVLAEMASFTHPLKPSIFFAQNMNKLVFKQASLILEL